MNRRAPILAAVVIALLAILVFVFLVLPKMSEVGQRQEELEQARQEQVGLEAQLAQLQQTQQQAAEIRRQLVRIRRQVPPVADLPGIIDMLDEIADTSELDFFSISPGDPAPSLEGGAAVIPAEVVVIGGFFEVDEFLFRLETAPRAAKVVTLAIGEGPEELPQIQATMSVEFYTRDEAAGPGAPVAPPEPSPSPEASPSPEEGSPTPTASPTEET